MPRNERSVNESWFCKLGGFWKSSCENQFTVLKIVDIIRIRIGIREFGASDVQFYF